MKKILIVLLACFTCTHVYSAATPIYGVRVDTNGLVLAPTNFWSANASNISGSVTAGQGLTNIAGVLSANGDGSQLVNLNGANIQAGTIESNKLTPQVQAQLALAGSGGGTANTNLPASVPPNYPGLSATLSCWLDASISLTPNTFPTNWVDLSGKGNNATNVVTNGLVALSISNQTILSFSGGHLMTPTNVIQNSNWVMIFVFQPITPGAGGDTPFSVGGGAASSFPTNGLYIEASSGGWSGYPVSWTNFTSGSGQLYEPHEWQIYTLRFDGTNLEGRINGQWVFRSANTPMPILNGRICLGSMVDGSFASTMNLLTFASFTNGILKDPEIAAVENWLRIKFASLIPNNRPIFNVTGDSIAAGLFMSPLTNAFPWQVGSAIGGTNAYQIGIQGIGGETVSTMLANVQPLLSSWQYLPQAKTELVEGLANDIIQGHTAAAMLSDVTNLCLRFKSVGARVIFATPTAGTNYSAAQETQRQIFLSLANSNWWTWCDGLATVGSDSIVGQTNQMASTTWTFDGTHPTTAATLLMVPYMVRALSSKLDQDLSPHYGALVFPTNSAFAGAINGTTNGNAALMSTSNGVFNLVVSQVGSTVNQTFSFNTNGALSAPNSFQAGTNTGSSALSGTFQILSQTNIPTWAQLGTNGIALVNSNSFFYLYKGSNDGSSVLTSLLK